jgi:hypothetical protein
MLARLIEREWNEGYDLTNRISIEVGTASFRSVRGLTIVAALLDELAFWPQEDSANPDAEVVNAIKPGMATIPTSMLLCASSPYSRKGVLWDAHKVHFGKDGPVLVWQAETRELNPTVPQELIDAAMEADPANAQAEWLGRFRSDIEAFVRREAVEACISAGIYERPREDGVAYSAFVDPSGGSADSMTIAVAHKAQDGLATVDAIRERKPPFSPADVVSEFAALLRSYGITRLLGDRYGGEFVREPFRAFNISYELAPKPKSDLYRDCLPLINSKQCDLLDHPKMLNQLIGLERRTARSGKDSIDHSPGGHDDIANVVAGVIVCLGERKYKYDSSLAWVSNEKDEVDFEAWRTGRLHSHIFAGTKTRGLF